MVCLNGSFYGGSEVVLISEDQTYVVRYPSGMEDVAIKALGSQGLEHYDHLVEAIESQRGLDHNNS
jgi:hypothetical protein